MKITIEIETDADGRAIAARVIGGGVRKVPRKRPPITLARTKDSEELILLREFVAEHGPSGAARLLNVSKAAVYQWAYRGSIPEKYVDMIGTINTAREGDHA